MTADELAVIVAHPLVTNEAFRLIMLVAARGDGEQEITADELRMVLGCKSDTPVQKARVRAVSLGFIGWKQGGRGHGNVYTYLRPAAWVSDIPSPHGMGKSPVVVVSSSSNPPSPPVELKPLAADADELIQAERETLGDAFKPLVSYLRRRVAAESQEPYAGRVLGALDPECMNPQWRDATGAVIPLPRRRAIMADALNELGTADETKDRKWKAGDWGNLRNKLKGLIGAENESRPQYRSSIGTRAPPRKDAPTDTQDYKPTETFRGFNG